MKFIQTNKKKANSNRTNSLIKFGSYAILIILIVTFVGAPILSNSGSNGANLKFGKYASYEITYESNNYFGQSVQELIEQYSSQFSKDNTNFFISTAWRQGFDKTVLHYALLDNAKISKYEPSKESILDIIATYPSLQTDGEFDIKLYNTVSDSTKKKMFEFQKEVSTSSKIYEDIIDITYVNSKEMDFLEKLNNNRRAFNYVRFSKLEIQDQDFLKEYGIKNKDKFKKIEFKSITVETESEAQTIYDRIINQETTFEESVSAFSIDSAKENNGERGSLYAYQIENDDGEVALNILQELQNTEDISEVVAISSGNFAIYSLLSEIIEPDFNILNVINEQILESDKDTPHIDSLLDDIQDYLNTHEPAIVEDKILNISEEFILEANKTDFISVADNFALEVGTIPLAPLNVDNISILDSMISEDGPGISQLVSEQDILSDLFILESIDDISKPYIVSDYVYVFQLTNIVNSATAKNNDTTIYENDYKNQVNMFIQDTNTQLIRKAVIEEHKLTDNFNKSFQTIYDSQ